MKLTNDKLDSIDHGKISILAVFDMSVAFDTLDHATLLHRLEHTFGLSGFIHIGAPQGWVLGPLLFVLFISSIARVIQSTSELSNKDTTVSFHKINSMQFGFMAGKSTKDGIFIVRQLQEKYLARNKELWMAFVDLEKAFDRVPREVIWWALRCLGVDEWIVSMIKAMFEDATMVRVNGRESKAFIVRVHQGSVLSPLLFIIVLKALSESLEKDYPWSCCTQIILLWLQKQRSC